VTVWCCPVGIPQTRSAGSTCLVVLGIGSARSPFARFCPPPSSIAEVGFIEEKCSDRYRTAHYQQIGCRDGRRSGSAPGAPIVAISGPPFLLRRLHHIHPIIFVTSLTRWQAFCEKLKSPGGNVTGVFILQVFLDYFEATGHLQRTGTGTKTIAFLYNSTGITSKKRAIEPSTGSGGARCVKILLFNVNAPLTWMRARKSASAGAGALVVNSDAVFPEQSSEVIALAAHQQLHDVLHTRILQRWR